MILHFYQIAYWDHENQLNNIKTPAEKHRLNTNDEKTNVIVFERGGHLAAHEKWCVGKVRLIDVTEYRYLGNVVSTNFPQRTRSHILLPEQELLLFRCNDP